MKFDIPRAFLIVILLANCKDGQQTPKTILPDSMVTMENDQIKLGIDLVGGAYVDFHLKEKPLNPFGWKLLPEQMPGNNQPFTFEGHFLCTGRWGEPSPGEMVAGIPHNGEVNTREWILASPPDIPDFESMLMFCEAPIEKLDVRREILIPDHGNYFMVREWFTNNLPIGRLTNVVQHGTIASPFLSETTRINTNATWGFDQRTNYKYLEDSSFIWPNGKMADGSAVDLSRVDTEMGFVTSHIFEDSIGWITALNPGEGILLGYIWKTSDYPWLNVWHMSEQGKPYVQGLEFGTTGLGKSYELLVENQVTFYGQNSFEYIDAGETMEKSWICFMLEVPDTLQQVTSITMTDQAIIIAHQDHIMELAGTFSW
jgi:hypothetical protein